MAPFGVLAPMFDDDVLPAAFTQGDRNPLKLKSSQKGDEDSDEYSDAVEEDAEYDDDEDGPRPSIKKRARFTAVTVKRGQSTLPPAHPHYGEQVLTPRQQGYQAKRKPVLVDMDTDDETIWNMKNAGYKDDPVALHLIQQGRHHYDPKTIATRYSRMRKIQASQEEKILDEDFSDFHEEDDAQLPVCVISANAQYEKDLEVINVRCWERIAGYMNADRPSKKWTKNSARARFESLQNGTALLPLEQDPEAHIRIALRTSIKTKNATARQEKTDQARREKREAKDKAEKEAAELARKRLIQEEERKNRRIENEAKKAENARLREERSKIKMEEQETRADRMAKTAAERIVKKSQVEQARSARKWEKDQEKLLRARRKQETLIEKIQREADEKKAKIVADAENDERRALIRKHMRGAGILTAAPREAEAKQVARRAGNYARAIEKDLVEEEEDKKPSREELDRAAAENEEAEAAKASKGPNWSPWTVKGRAALKKSGKKV